MHFGRAGAVGQQVADSAQVPLTMRILFITQYFPPETGAAPARAAHFVRALQLAGHEVEVLTGLPNHPSGEVEVGYQGGRHDPDRFGPTPVHRVWLYATPHKTAWTRLWNQASFALSALPAALRTRRAELVLASVPPLFLGVTAWLASIRHRAPLVIDCRDDWPRAAVALGEIRPGVAAGLLGWLSSFLYGRAARMLAVTPGMKRQFEARGFDPKKVSLLTNGADTETFHPAAATPDQVMADSGPALTVLYAGTHGLVHGMDVILDAAETFRGRPEVRFLLVGDGVAKRGLEARVRRNGLQNVEFRPSVPPDQLVNVIQAADICLVTTRPDPFCGETIPVKLFDYLACGRPVVAAVIGDAAAVIRESGAGVVVQPGDPGALAHALVSLMEDAGLRARMGAAGPGYVATHYSRAALGKQLVGILEEVADRSRRRAAAIRPGGWYGATKRLFDLAVALTLSIVLTPVLLVIATLVRVDSSGPALFRQRRMGRASSEFTIFKFRTMKVGTPDLASHLVGPGATEVTRLGRVLRRTSLDELPQLLNILRGEMSLVGPRPALFNQYDLIAMRRDLGIDALKPGVTGWAQVHGRDDLAIGEKVEYDRQYLDACSLSMDLTILVRTAAAVLSSRGVY